MSETLIVGDEDQVRTKLHVLNVLTTLLFELDLGLKQCPAHLLVTRSFSYQHLIILNRGLPSFQLPHIIIPRKKIDIKSRKRQIQQEVKQTLR